MAKPAIRKQIREAKEALKDVMLEHLTEIAENTIAQIMKNYKKLPAGRAADAIKGLKESGVSEYKKNLLSGLAIIVAMALEQARKEVPSKAKLSEWDEEAVAMGEFEKLPPKIQKRLKSQVDLLTTTQKADLDKVILFQFSSSLGTTDSESLLEYDLYESAEDWLNGPAISAGSGVMAARGINEARQAYFFEDDVLEQVDAFMFMNDVPETDICADLSNNGQGKIFAKDDPEFQRYTPPLHYNCDSYILPILKGKLKGREIERLKPSKSELEAQIQFHDGKCCDGKVFIAQREY